MHAVKSFIKPLSLKGAEKCWPGRNVLQCFDEMSRGGFAWASVRVNAKRLLGNFQQITANARRDISHGMLRS